MVKLHVLLLVRDVGCGIGLICIDRGNDLESQQLVELGSGCHVSSRCVPGCVFLFSDGVAIWYPLP